MEGIPSFSLYSRSVRGKGSRSRGELGAQGSTFPLLKFSWTVPGLFPFGVCHQGFFSPLAFFPLLDLYLFRAKGKGNPPFFAIPFTSQVLTLHLSSGWE